MTANANDAGYPLLDEAWIPVLDSAGRRRHVSLLELFEQAHEIRMLACELPTQNFAILRLALAILHRATDGPPGEAAWQHLWQAPRLPYQEIVGYLGDYRDRFDLLHPTRPFYQVADLRTGKDDAAFGLEKLIADVPNGHQFLTTRAGRGMASITPAEATRWLVHCQAYDPSGIHTGAVGDPRVKDGKVFAHRSGRGVGPLGLLGGIYIEGFDLRETLLLNLIPVGAAWREEDERDKPAWERPQLSIVEEAAPSRGPYGLLGLYTWQSRRIRLFGGRAGVTGAVICYGDPLTLHDKHAVEPMSVWRRSAGLEKAEKRIPVYVPRAHDHTRALWRGLQVLLPAPPAAGAEPPQTLPPLVLRWLARLTRTGVVDQGFRVRPRAVSVTYGTQQAVIDEVFGDSLTMSAQLLLEESALRTTAVDAAADAEAAVNQLRDLARNLVRAAGGDPDAGDAERASERGYALLDRHFRDWLARLRPDSDPVAARTTWQRLTRRAISQVGRDLVDSAGPNAWVGRTVTDRNGRDIHHSSSQAEAWFRAGLSRVLPMGTEDEPDELAGPGSEEKAA